MIESVAWFFNVPIRLTRSEDAMAVLGSLLGLSCVSLGTWKHFPKARRQLALSMQQAIMD